MLLTCALLKRSAITKKKQNSFLHFVRFSVNEYRVQKVHPNVSLVDDRNAPIDFSSSAALVYESVISRNEGDLLVKDIQSRMKRRRYEKDHWDAVITGYREVEIPHPNDMMLVSDIVNQDVTQTEDFSHRNLSEVTSNIIARIRSILQSNFFRDQETSLRWLPCHAIDLKRDGDLSAHVDSIKFSGKIVAGLSLNSSSIMRLKPDKDSYSGQTNLSNGHIDLLLQPLSLYVLSEECRFRYTHELLPCGSIFSSTNMPEELKVERNQRFSLIFRDAKNTEPT